MAHRKALSLTVGVLAGLAVSLAIWAMPQPAHAGGVRLSIGIGIPAPVYVAPPPVVVHPAPIIVQPAPGIVYPPPGIVYPPPGIVYPPPVVYTVPYDVYGRPLPPGLAKKYYGHHPAHGYKFYKHGKRGW